MFKHTKERPFGCVSCEKRFTNKESLQRHTLIHTGEKPYQCANCLMRFRHCSSLKVHRLNNPDSSRVERSIGAPFETSRSRPNAVPLLYLCPRCPYKTKSKGHLHQHIKIKHLNSRPYPCTICGARFSMKIDLSRHTLTHTGFKPHKCPRCGKGFIRNDRMLILGGCQGLESPLVDNGDLLNVDPDTFEADGDLKHKCPFCNYKSKFRPHIRRHIMFKHTKEKPFACTACDKRFANKENLLRHTLIHTGEKPYQCENCLLRFRHRWQEFGSSVVGNRDLLNVDDPETLEVDTDSKHKCPFCDYKSKFKPHVRRHIMFKHTKERPFGCVSCEKRFTNKESLQRHTLIHTGEKPYQCANCLMRFRHCSSLKTHKLNNPACS
ncbi:Zinc finger protein 84 [Armadillidium nasatum]|uniref:Zinc finger protein 84 n=1 Tax=Armadillidium nasatum TaxID=96803 RepID=A0A5N5TAW3_9CRUS|nr:Zinc finger protein 84 [Armadillidium nasatum]